MLVIYNTPKRKKEKFIPYKDNIVTMYNCGLTVYDRAHIGNLRAFTMADIIRRVLEFVGYKVIQVQNFTDVGHETLTDEQKQKIKGKIEITDTDYGIDRLEKTAQKEGISVWDVAEFYIKKALKDFKEMNFLEPHYRPRATEHIKEQQDLIKELLKRGYAYITNSAIYYDISKFDKYWDFTGQKPDEKKIAVRAELEIDPEKKHPYDFRLWQFNRPDHTMQWNFYWEGKNYRGYPGWHIECSAMANKYLGNPIDIHTGGADHIQVHHPNEIAQSEPVFGEPFVRYWYHNGFLTVDGTKMGKSLGNAYNLDDIKAKNFAALDLRYFYLTADFRKPQNFTWEALEAAKSTRNKINRLMYELIINSQNKEKNTNSSLIKKYKTKFVESIEDSFNMPMALAVFWDMIENKRLSPSEKIKLTTKFDKVFGLNILKEAKKYIKPIPKDVISKIEKIIKQRLKAKKLRNYQLADNLRQKARKLGFELIDNEDGTTSYRRI